MSKKAQELAARYGRRSDILEMVKEIIEEKYHVSAFTNPVYPIVTSDIEIQAYHWGLIPFWIKTQKDADNIRQKTYNARSETLFEKPSFRNAVSSKRCIVPSTGWFEWKQEGNKKKPYFIYEKENEIFSMAGIYDNWTNQSTGEVLSTFSIITTEANELMRIIHNTKFRMPVLLSKEDESIWLNPDVRDHEVIQSMLKPFDSNKMDAYIIRNDFLKKSPFDVSVLEPA